MKSKTDYQKAALDKSPAHAAQLTENKKIGGEVGSLVSS